jgi:hypothetical protein
MFSGMVYLYVCRVKNLCDTMYELNKIAEELMDCYEAKITELNDHPRSKQFRALNNYKAAIDCFKQYIPKAERIISKGQLQRKDIITDFRNEARFIKANIDRITC